jgi:branched-chain amino acid transport system permease protein
MLVGLGPMRWSVFSIFVLAVGAYPVVFQSNYLVGAGIVVGVMAVATVGFILLVGYARQLAVGQAAFCMIGGYGSALLCTRADVDPMSAMLVSAIISMAVAFVIGLPILRLRGYALAMASLSFQLILGFTVVQSQSITGGAAGIWGIPKFSILGLQLATDISYFYFVWFFVIVAVAVGLVIDRSAIGRALRAIASSERAATSIGMNIAQYKLQMFVLSAGFASLTGSLTVHYLRIISPDVFGYQYSLNMITAVVAGGLNSIAGGVVGATVVVGLREALRITQLPELEGIIMGALTVIVLIAFPSGIVGAYDLLFERLRLGKKSCKAVADARPTISGPPSINAVDHLARTGLTSGELMTVNRASRAFGSLRAVDDVGFTVRERSITSLIGSNGAGKTTLFDMICGLQTLDSGSVVLAGQRVEAQQPHVIARLGMARSFQNPELFDGLTVLENVMAGTHRYTTSGVMATVALMPSVYKRERLAITEAERCLAFVGMSDFHDHFPGMLSFGQQRLVEIARALALKPIVLLMDEPASGLNDTETERLGYLLQQIRKAGLTILLIEHDLRLVMGVSDHLVVMNHGKKIAEGPPQEIRRDPEVVAAYLGAMR